MRSKGVKQAQFRKQAVAWNFKEQREHKAGVLGKGQVLRILYPTTEVFFIVRGLGAIKKF